MIDERWPLRLSLIDPGTASSAGPRHFIHAPSSHLFINVSYSLRLAHISIERLEVAINYKSFKLVRSIPRPDTTVHMSRKRRRSQAEEQYNEIHEADADVNGEDSEKRGKEHEIWDTFKEEHHEGTPMHRLSEYATCSNSLN